MINPLTMRSTRAQIVVLKSHSPIRESGLSRELGDIKCVENMYTMSLEFLVTPDKEAFLND